jgi:pyruvate dehydrogenase E1 component
VNRHFEVDAAHIVVATLSGLVDTGALTPAAVSDAIRHHGIDPDGIDPSLP